MTPNLAGAGRPWWRPALAWAVLLAVLGAWWLTVAPTFLHGPATYVMVQGHSMEPMLHTGDLVMARAESAYQVGDLVVIHIYGGSVIHRLVAKSPQGTWVTQGDNNSYTDPWDLTDSDIAGKYTAMLPQGASYLTWPLENPLQFGVICAALAALTYVPLRRRRISPVLAAALATAEREPRRDGRSNLEYGTLAVSATASLAGLICLVSAWASHDILSTRGITGILTLLWAGSLTVYFTYRLYDGRGVQEPSKSMYALAGRLYLVDEMPELDAPAADLGSAVALRSIAEKYRLPVLHRIDPTTGGHEFLLITVQRGVFRWLAVPAAEGTDGGASWIDKIMRPDLDKPQAGLARMATRVLRPLAGGAATAVLAVSMLGSTTSTRPLTLASTAGVAAGALLPDGDGRNLNRRRLAFMGLWAVGALAAWLALSQRDWIGTHLTLLVIAAAALAGIAAGWLVLRFGPDDRPPEDEPLST